MDGFIVRPSETLPLFEKINKDWKEWGYTEVSERVDTVIMGRRTYENIKSQVDKVPYIDKDTYIITREMRQREGRIRFYADDPKELVNKLQMKGGKDILVDGGAEIVRMMLRDDLLDELIITIVPMIVGNGIRLFGDQIQGVDLKLIESKSYDSGLVQLVYKISKNSLCRNMA
ncbi:MAG TPA: dihydrofolate reductase family protein [Anditalea sp.]|nr:dihydrofolate reductase family protein [Anditalea sp.]